MLDLLGRGLFALTLFVVAVVVNAVCIPDVHLVAFWVGSDINHFIAKSGDMLGGVLKDVVIFGPSVEVEMRLAELPCGNLVLGGKSNNGPGRGIWPDYHHLVDVWRTRKPVVREIKVIWERGGRVYKIAMRRESFWGSIARVLPNDCETQRHSIGSRNELSTQVRELRLSPSVSTIGEPLSDMG